MRVVSLLPAATDIVCALGAAELLAGVTHACDAEGLPAGVPRVTHSVVDANAAPVVVDRLVRAHHAAGAALFTVDEAAIAAARPDLIITQSHCDVCAVDERGVRALAARLVPAPRVFALGAQTLDDVLRDITRVADAIDCGDEAAELVAGLRARMSTVHSALMAAAAPRPFAAVIEWTDPVFAAGHWVPDMVKRAGGLDVLAHAGEPSTERPARAVHDAWPAIVLVAPCGYDLARAEVAGRELLAQPEWHWMRERTVWAMDGNRLISRPSPHLVDGVEAMARIFNPAVFSPLSCGLATRLA
jgi:iron complex transport system substrate-binding protein